MPARLTVHPRLAPVAVRVVREGEVLTLGRDPDNDFRIDDTRVSKRHARLVGRGDGFWLEDLGSKNGSSVNGLPPGEANLAHGDWVSFGGVVGRFERLTDDEVRAGDQTRARQRKAAETAREALTTEVEPKELLRRLLESAVRVVEAERGFVLVTGADGVLIPAAAFGLDTTDIGGATFGGSVGAVDRAVQTGAPVVVANAAAEEWLARRESVIDQGLATIVCVPLAHGRRILGALYLDSRTRGAGFTELDVELLEALADHAAVLLGGMDLARRIRHLAGVPEEGGEPVLAALEQRLGRMIRAAAPTEAGFGGAHERGGSGPARP